MNDQKYGIKDILEVKIIDEDGNVIAEGDSIETCEINIDTEKIKEEK